MPIVRLAEQIGAFNPDQIAILTIAHEGALKRLGIADRTSSAAEAVAKTIIELAKAGERDPDNLREAAIKRLSGA